MRLTLLALLVPLLGSSQTTAVTVRKAYIDRHDRVHILYSSGRHWVMSKDKYYAAQSDIRVAEDSRTVGWLLEIPNCCTSYPIPVTLAVRRPGLRVRYFTADLMLCLWQFRNGGDQVAISSDTVHGNLSPVYTLYDVRTERKLDEWQGNPSDKAPQWVRDLDPIPNP